MLAKLCSKCGRIMEFGKPHCPSCVELYGAGRKSYHREYDLRARNKKSTAFYNSVPWRKLREVKMREAAWSCEACARKGLTVPAEEVHHKIPITVDWSKRLDEGNLICLCHACHMSAHGHKSGFEGAGGYQKSAES